MKLFPIMALTLAAWSVVGCGSDGSSSGTLPAGKGGLDSGSGLGPGPDASATAVVSLQLSSRLVTSATPATVTATVVDGNGQKLEGRVVTFSSAGKGQFSANTALTNADGQAIVSLYPAPTATTGADAVTASALINGTKYEATEGFQLTATSIEITDFRANLAPGASLSAYGQADFTVTITGAAPGVPVSVSLSSLCAGKAPAKATIVPATVTTTNGTASFTYKDQGCGVTEKNDVLQALVVGGASNKSLNLPLASPSANNIQFASASPNQIYLKGSGLVESSVVTFMVVDLAGNPLPNQDVTLSAVSLAGGLTLDGGSAAVVKKSDVNGKVSVTVNAGTVPTPVQITAALANGTSTVSNALTIGGGLPTQTGFSLSQDTFNIEGGNAGATRSDNEKNTYSVKLTDRRGNPAPDNVAVTFSAEGGSIQVSALSVLKNGASTATASFTAGGGFRPDDRRVTILAYALGEESFTDVNGNNIYDPGEPFQDLGQPYRNAAYDGVFGSADLPISVSTGVGTAACTTSGQTAFTLDVTKPNRPNTCDGVWGRAYIRAAAETVLSYSEARPYFLGASGGTANFGCEITSIADDSRGHKVNLYPLGCLSLTGAPKAGAVALRVADINRIRLNPMAAGTKITATGSQGLTVQAPTGSPVPSTLEATVSTIDYQFDDKTTVGTISVSFQSPSGLTTSFAFGVSQ